MLRQTVSSMIQLPAASSCLLKIIIIYFQYRYHQTTNNLPFSIKFFAISQGISEASFRMFNARPHTPALRAVAKNGRQL